jgi:hypothetical protein
LAERKEAFVSCERWERHIALAAGDDLDENEIRALELHLAECFRCRYTEAEFAAVRAELHSLRDVDSPELDALRLNVMNAVHRRRESLLRSAVGLAAGMLALALGWTVYRPGEIAPPPRPPAIVATAVAPQPIVAAKSIEPKPSRDQRERSPILVKLYTDDPDVVILWIAD